MKVKCMRFAGGTILFRWQKKRKFPSVVIEVECMVFLFLQNKYTQHPSTGALGAFGTAARM